MTNERPSNAPNSGEASPDSFRQLVLMKKDQRFVFRYQLGHEQQMLNNLVELARDTASDLDWFDVAVLSHQLGQNMGKQLDNLMKSA